MTFAEQFETVVLHEPTDACHGWHCHAHGVDENHAGAYITCRECGHVYRRRRDLRRALRRRATEVLHSENEITVCQECPHDF